MAVEIAGVKSLTLPKFIVNRFRLKECTGSSKPDYIDKSKIALYDNDGHTLHVEDLFQLRDILSYFRSAGQVCLHLIYKHMIIERNDEKGDESEGVVGRELAELLQSRCRGGVGTTTIATAMAPTTQIRLPLKKVKPKRRLFDNMTGVKVRDLIDSNALICATIDRNNDRDNRPGQRSLVIGGDRSSIDPIDAKASPNANANANVNLTLRFGISKSVFQRRPSKYLLEVCHITEEDERYYNEFYRHLLLKTRKASTWKKSRDVLFSWITNPYK